MPKSWPSSPLAAAQRAFDLLVTPPAPLAFDLRGFTGLPPRIVPLDELKRILIDDETPRLVRDRVWRELVTRARRDGPSWMIAAVGIAMPGLRRMAGMLANGWHGETQDRDAEMLTGFLDRIATVDLNEPRICGRLIDAGARAVKHARERDEAVDTVAVPKAWSLPPRHPYDHPDWVLIRALAAAVIDPEEYQLISETRLEEIPLQAVADTLCVSVPVAVAWRRKGELRLLAAVADGELDQVSILAVGAARRRAAATKADAGTEHTPSAGPADTSPPARTLSRSRGRQRHLAGAAAAE